MHGITLSAPNTEAGCHQLTPLLETPGHPQASPGYITGYTKQLYTEGLSICQGSNPEINCPLHGFEFPLVFNQHTQRVLGRLKIHKKAD